MSDTDLSVIVAHTDARQPIAEWLRAVAPQILSRRVELIVCVTPTVGGDGVDLAAIDRARLVRSDRPCLVPHLWGLGALAARGDVIAFTISACLPAPDWIQRILRAHRAPIAAVGGAIEIAADATLTDRSVHLVRYTPYLRPFAAGPVREIPGDNGTYKRAALEPSLETIRAVGFWETDVNQALLAARATLWADPDIVVFHTRSFTVGGFARQRFAHGRIFGSRRARRSSGARRAMYLVTAPAIPLLYLARITRTLLRKRRHLGTLLATLPLVVWFLLCWTVGEATGLLNPRE